MKKMRIGFLVSGNGGTLKFVHQVMQLLSLPLEVVTVIGDRACGALEYARAVGLPYQQLTYTRAAPAALQEALREVAPELVVTNIHKVLDADTLQMLPGRFINLHYSLLPAFKGSIGMQPVEQAHQLNATVVGATCHEVTEQVDDGRCLAQCALGVDWTRDALHDVQELVFRGAGLVLLQALLQRAGQVTVSGSAALTMLDRPLLFAPALGFSLQMLDEAFWRKVKNS